MQTNGKTTSVYVMRRSESVNSKITAHNCEANTLYNAIVEVFDEFKSRIKYTPEFSIILVSYSYIKVANLFNKDARAR